MTTVTRPTIIAGNWKMNYGPEEAARFTREIAPEINDLLHVDHSTLCILCPPSISLSAVRSVLDAQPFLRVELGA
ncbi:MAG: triose-phosphate isomerase, partial [Chloroflexota bacterium]|nr:triose-phosphate isomerase [Chloroflexota bacterium]